jgi:hypothetical protein
MGTVDASALGAMHLRDARLCLDCEEVHCDERCPACASDVFAFVSNWVPSDHRAQSQRPRPSPRNRPMASTGTKVAAGGSLGLAIVAAVRRLTRGARPTSQ